MKNLKNQPQNVMMVLLNLILQVMTASSRFLKSLIKRSKSGKRDHILPQKIVTQINMKPRFSNNTRRSLLWVCVCKCLGFVVAAVVCCF